MPDCPGIGNMHSSSGTVSVPEPVAFENVANRVGGLGLLSRKQDQAVNNCVIGTIVGDEWDLIVEGARCNPCIGCLNGAAFSLSGERNLGPSSAQFAAHW